MNTELNLHFKKFGWNLRYQYVWVINKSYLYNPNDDTLFSVSSMLSYTRNTQNYQ